MFDGGPSEVGDATAMDEQTPDGTEYAGLPANDACLIAVDDPDRFLENTQTGSFNDEEGALSECPLDPDDQAEAAPVAIDLDDVNPGDFGEVTFDFRICDNPGFVWLNGELNSASENGVTEPEADDPQEGGPENETITDAAAIADSDIELLDVVQTAVWVDDGDNYQDGDESPTVQSLGDLLESIGGEGPGVELAGNTAPEDGGGASDARNCFAGDEKHSIAFAWWVPIDHGNEIQSDSVSFDLGLYAEQCRHNDGSGMNAEETEDGGDDTEAFDVFAGDEDDELTAVFTVQSEDDGESLTSISLDHDGGTDISNTGSGDVDVALDSTNIDSDIGDVSGANNGTTLEITLGGNNDLSSGDTLSVVYNDVQNRGDTSSVTGTINGDGSVTDSQPLTPG